MIFKGQSAREKTKASRQELAPRGLKTETLEYHATAWRYPVDNIQLEKPILAYLLLTIFYGKFHY